MSEAKRIIRAQRPNILRSIVGLGLLAIAAAMFVQSTSIEMKVLSWAAAGLLAVLACRIFARTVFASHIILNEQGFRLGGLFAQPLVSWTDIDKFGTLTLSRKTFVIYSLKNRVERPKRGSMLLRGLPSTADGYLPHSSEMSAEELLDVLNTWKARQL